MPTAPTASAFAAVRRFCRWHVFPSQQETATVDGTGTNKLVLKTLHLTDITSVTINDQAIEDYTWDTGGIVTRSRGRWPRGIKNITIDFTHGYPNVPDDLDAVLESIAARAGAFPIAGAEQQNAGPFGVRFTKGYSGGLALLESEKQALADYRVPVGF
ncbi:MAG: hypothetical protein HZY75_13340 [Nocardioidaceae bacterium]|nr:MAG: hypothetical protein HZY75_13340 [Nocardioidaceae bacterium]